VRRLASGKLGFMEEGGEALLKRHYGSRLTASVPPTSRTNVVCSTGATRG
jgi:hypothetical protein